MSFFVFPRRWIVPALAAATLAFGALPHHNERHVVLRYVNLPGNYIAATRLHPVDPLIWIDKRPRSYWRKWKVQCVLVHEYGHLAGRGHSANPRSIMYPLLRSKTCFRFLARHEL